MTAQTHPPKDTLINARDVTLRLNDHPILEDVSLTVSSGERIGLIGPNGAGKSSLLRVLGGLWPMTSGDISLMSRPLKSYSTREVARLVAHVPQSTTMDFAFTVQEVVLMGRSPYLGRLQIESAADRQIAADAMRVMEVDDLAHRFINTLSGGERQRAFIARALAQQPRVLLLDEPTANLDVRHQLAMLKLVARLAHEEGLAVIAAIHDLDLAAHFSDRLILLDKGRLLSDASPEDVLIPENLARTFHVQARLFRDPFTNALRLSLSSANGSSRAQPGEQYQLSEEQLAKG